MKPENQTSGEKDWYHDEMMEHVREGQFVCYECRDGLHMRCVGVPCMCPCPIQFPNTKNEVEYFI
jgi:hypothetical protein